MLNENYLRSCVKIADEQECHRLLMACKMSGEEIPEESLRRLEEIIKKRKRPWYYATNTIGKRIAVVLLAILILAATVTFTVEAIKKIKQWNAIHVETYEKYSDIRFVAAELYYRYVISDLPAGFEQKRRFDSNNKYITLYSDQSGKEIVLMQTPYYFPNPIPDAAKTTDHSDYQDKVMYYEYNGVHKINFERFGCQFFIASADFDEDELFALTQTLDKAPDPFENRPPEQYGDKNDN